MSYSSRYDRGDWKAVCESCGRIVKASQLQKRWDGYMVDERCWEPRQPQDFVRGVADYQAPPFTRPEQSDSFISISFSSLLSYITTSTATLITRKITPVIKAITALVTSSVTLTYGKFYFKAITSSLTSTATLVAEYFKGISSKAVDANSVNKTTLG